MLPVFSVISIFIISEVIIRNIVVSSTVYDNSKYIVEKHGWQHHLAGSIQLDFFGGKTKIGVKPFLPRQGCQASIS